MKRSQQDPVGPESPVHAAFRMCWPWADHAQGEKDGPAEARRTCSAGRREAIGERAPRLAAAQDLHRLELGVNDVGTAGVVLLAEPDQEAVDAGEVVVAGCDGPGLASHGEDARREPHPTRRRVGTEAGDRGPKAENENSPRGLRP